MAKQPRAKVVGMTRNQRMGIANQPQTYERVQRGYLPERLLRDPRVAAPRPNAIRADPWEGWLGDGNHRDGLT